MKSNTREEKVPPKSQTFYYSEPSKQSRVIDFFAVANLLLCRTITPIHIQHYNCLQRGLNTSGKSYDMDCNNNKKNSNNNNNNKIDIHDSQCHLCLTTVSWSLSD